MTSKVSVCIPTYNRAKLLKIAIESVLMQNCDDYEIIVTDNSDNNETKEMVEKLNHQQIRYYKNEKNLGMIGNWNRCLEYANGGYIKFLLDDDTFEQDILKIQSEILDENPNVGLTYCYIIGIDEKGNILEQNPFGITKETYKVSEEDYLEPGINCIIHYITDKWLVGCPTAAMVRKKCFEELGNFDDWGWDPEMWLRICSKYDFYYNSQHLANWRIYADSGTVKYLSKDLLLFEHVYKTLDKIYKDPVYSNVQKRLTEYKKIAYFSVSKKAFNNLISALFRNEFTVAREILLRILRYDKYFSNKIFLPFYFMASIIKNRMSSK